MADCYETLIKKTMLCIKGLSTIILENGGETYRVEESIERIVQSQKLGEADVFALPTGVFVSIWDETKQVHSLIVRSKKRSVDLEKIANANQIARSLSQNLISLDQALVQCEALAAAGQVPKSASIASAGLSAAFFTLLFQGHMLDCWVALLCGAAIQGVTLSFKRINIFHFLNSFLGGFLAAFIAVAAVPSAYGGSLDKIIIGAITPLLPGLALTGAVKDIMTGNLVAGISRFGEALLIACGIAFGVWTVLYVYSCFGGSL